MKYEKVDNIEDADYWIPLYDHRFVKFYKRVIYKILEKKFVKDDHVTFGKKYKIIISIRDGEYVIKDDNGKENNLFLLHNGYFVKVLYESNT